MNGGSDITLNQTEPVAAVSRCGTIRETEVVQSAVEPIARTVASEDSSGPVAAMSRRSKTDNKKPSTNWSEAWNRPSPILPIAKSPNFGSGDFFPISDKPRTPPAVDDLTLGR